MADKKVAVVVVHGVADQQPSESARQIADLLTDLCPLGKYTTFEEAKIRIPVEPVIKLKKDADGNAIIEPKVHKPPFEERNDDALLRHRGETPLVDDPEHGFMFDQLRGYDPDAEDQPRVFETVRLDGVRNATNCDVHVYEAYWADLSRRTKGILSFFGELYQLLLHLPSLGRNAVDYARAEDKGHLWPLFSWFHRWSVRWLTLFIVVLNLVMATLVLPLMAPWLTQPPKPPTPKPFHGLAACCGLAKVDARNEPGAPTIAVAAVGDAKVPSVVDVVTQVVLALALFGITAWVLRHQRPPAWLWAIAPLAAAAAGLVLAYWINGKWGWGSGRLLVSEAWVVSAALIALALSKYQTMRR
ncbi:MAG: hypothetical protein QOE68_3345, partial [Thermoanaerobaculia bacterium]|nr:hypothetical protein [Thermoanaerobaculia bacterium]